MMIHMDIKESLYLSDCFQEREAREMFDKTSRDERIPLTDSPKDDSTNKN